MSQTRRAPIQFPCMFPIKAVGKDADEFKARVVEIVRRRVPDLSDDAVTTRPSAGGRYLAVTVSFVAQSQEQLDALYRELGAHEQVLMLL